MTRTLSLFLLLFISTSHLFCQSWYKLAGLSPHVTLQQVEVAQNGTIYVATSNDFIFYSNDNGTSWSPFLAPPSLSHTNNLQTLHFNDSTQTLFIGNNFGGISYAKNYGAIWGQEFFSSQFPLPLFEDIRVISSRGDLIVAAGDLTLPVAGVSDQRYFYSTNNGASWSAPVVTNELAFDILVDDDESWIVGTIDGLVKTSNFGSSWSSVEFLGEQVHKVAKSPAGVYYVIVQAGTSNTYRIHASNDLNTWQSLHAFTSNLINDLTFSSSLNSLLIATEEGLFEYGLTSTNFTMLASDVTLDVAANLNDHVMYASPAQSGLRNGSSPLFNWQNQNNGLSSTSSFKQDQFLISDSIIYTTTISHRLLSQFPILDSSQWNFSFVNDIAQPDATTNSFLNSNSNGTVYSGGKFNLYKKQGQMWSSITYPAIIPHSGTNSKYDFYYFNVDINDNRFKMISFGH